jgi:hypothetical protein
MMSADDEKKIAEYKNMIRTFYRVDTGRVEIIPEHLLEWCVRNGLYEAPGEQAPTSEEIIEAIARILEPVQARKN